MTSSYPDFSTVVDMTDPSPPPNNKEDNLDYSYYGPPGRYSPEGEILQAGGEAEIRQIDDKHKRHDASQQHQYPSQQEPRNQHSFNSSSYNQTQRNYAPPRAEERRCDPRTSSYRRENEGPRPRRERQWNTWIRPGSQEEEVERIKRPRTASLTDEEEQDPQHSVGPNSATSPERASNEISAQAVAPAPTDVTETEENLPVEAFSRQEQQEPVRSMMGASVASSPAVVSSTVAAAVVSSTPAAARQCEMDRQATVAAYPDREPSSDSSPATAVAMAAAAQSEHESSSSSNGICSFFYHDGEQDPMAFCCAKCRCTPEQRARYSDSVSQADDGDYFHRHCCHKVPREVVNENWLPPLQELQNGIYERQEDILLSGREHYPPPKPEVITRSQFGSRARRNRQNIETQVKNNDEIEHPVRCSGECHISFLYLCSNILLSLFVAA